MMSREVMILGNPILREISEIITVFQLDEIKDNIEDLKIALDEFRQKNGFGRGIAAIQIGVKKRIIALNLGEGTFVIVNPVIINRSKSTFSMWDDCMSFPDLLVKVIRNETIDIEYQDENGQRKLWENIEQSTAELLQHEIDHLDGILAIDRAIEKIDIIYKNEYVKNRDYYDKTVDYVIKPTI
jgi:peptide deformylase